jgi:hypothetical protein
MDELKKEIDKVIPKKGMFKQAGYFLNKLLKDIIAPIDSNTSKINNLEQGLNYLEQSLNELNSLRELINNNQSKIELVNSTFIKTIDAVEDDIALVMTWSFEEGTLPNRDIPLFHNADNYKNNAIVILDGEIKEVKSSYHVDLKSPNEHKISIISNKLDNMSQIFTTWNTGKYISTLGYKIKIPKCMTIIPYRFCFDRSVIEIVMPNSIIEIDSQAFSRSKITSIKLSNQIKKINSFAFGNTPCKTIIIPKLNAPVVDDNIFGNSDSTGLGDYGQYTAYSTRNDGVNKLIVPTGATGYEGGAWDVLLDPNKCGFTIEYSDELLEEIDNN